MSKNRLLIMTWRKYGDDDDSVTVDAVAADEEFDLKDSVAEEYGLDVLDGDERPGCIIITGRETVEDGEILEHGDRRFRILIEEIDEQGEALGGMCMVHWDVRCSPEGTCPKCKANEDQAQREHEAGEAASLSEGKSASE